MLGENVFITSVSFSTKAHRLAETARQTSQITAWSLPGHCLVIASTCSPDADITAPVDLAVIGDECRGLELHRGHLLRARRGSPDLGLWIKVGFVTWTVGVGQDRVGMSRDVHSGR